MTKKEQIEEIAKAIPKGVDYDNNECYIIGDSIHIAKTLYKAGYRKVSLDNDAAKEIALLKSELKKELEEHEAFVNNMKNVLEIEKKNAVREFVERIKSKMHNLDEGEASAYFLESDIDELLKEFFK